MTEETRERIENDLRVSLQRDEDVNVARSTLSVAQAYELLAEIDNLYRMISVDDIFSGPDELWQR